MHDLIEFLRARLDEDEQAARAATPGPWFYDSESKPQYGTHFVKAGPLKHDHPATGATWQATAVSAATDAAEDAHHIARHDPARVLADVDAKRRIIGQMADEAAEGEYWLEYWREGSRPGNNVEVAIWTLLTLALPYVDHPDYREEWRP